MPGTGSDVSTAAVWRDDTVEPERKTCVLRMKCDLISLLLIQN